MVNSDSLSESAQHGDILVVRLRIPKLSDQPLVQKLKAELLLSIADSLAKSVILDFQEVKFVGSIAFVALLGLRRVPNVERVVVCNLDPNVREIFALCRLISVDGSNTAPFEEADSVESALERCNQPG